MGSLGDIPFDLVLKGLWGWQVCGTRQGRVDCRQAYPKDSEDEEESQGDEGQTAEKVEEQVWVHGEVRMSRSVLVSVVVCCCMEASRLCLRSFFCVLVTGRQASTDSRGKEGGEEEG